ncbi:MAG: hypothetical protein ACREP3_15575 [Candidatus Binatia bacterium]
MNGKFLKLLLFVGVCMTPGAFAAALAQAQGSKPGSGAVTDQLIVFTMP